MSTLEKAIQYSRNSFANGEFIQRLGSLIEIVTDSKGSVSAQVLREYYTKGLSNIFEELGICLLYTSPSPRDQRGSRMPSSA